MDIKSGVKTTEFWVSLAGGIFGVMVTLGVFTADQAADLTRTVGEIAGGIITAISAAGYAVSRGIAKKG